MRVLVVFGRVEPDTSLSHHVDVAGPNSEKLAGACSGEQLELYQGAHGTRQMRKRLSDQVIRCRADSWMLSRLRSSSSQRFESEKLLVH